jgi:hypothetical protein
MKIIRVRSWGGFLAAIRRVRRDHGVYRREMDDGTKFTKETRILFRGQSDSRWKLETTLERATTEPYNVLRYTHSAAHHVYEIESFTGASWDVPPFPVYEKLIKDRSDVFDAFLPYYNYMVYLRHHGFPSPLLDWTESPFIAAHFALANSAARSAAVYCYIERPELIKGGTGGEPMITLKGPYVRTHKRHYAQKAWYTISTKWNYTEGARYFCPHERVFEKGTERQDLLIKIVLPRSVRSSALAELNDYNINDFTLFQTEDSLIKALAAKEFSSVRI